MAGRESEMWQLRIKFKKQYPDYEYKPLTPDLVPECLKLEEEWCRANNCEEQLALGAERKLQRRLGEVPRRSGRSTVRPRRRQ